MTCPVKKGEITITKTVKLPEEVPPVCIPGSRLVMKRVKGVWLTIWCEIRGNTLSMRMWCQRIRSRLRA